jgi:hypothetical protein
VNIRTGTLVVGATEVEVAVDVGVVEVLVDVLVVLGVLEVATAAVSEVVVAVSVLEVIKGVESIKSKQCQEMRSKDNRAKKSALKLIRRIPFVVWDACG